MNPIYKLRVEGRIRDHIVNLIVRGVIRDPRICWDVSVTRVCVSEDLGIVKVYISNMCGGSNSLSVACRGLNSAAGYVRMTLGKILRSRNTPKPVFLCDDKNLEVFQALKSLSSISQQNF